MNFLEIIVSASAEQAMFITALVNEQDCLGIEEIDNGFKAYFSASQAQEIEAWLLDLQQDFEFSFQIKKLKDENWNAKWESDYQPIFVGDFCAIYAPFHTSTGNYNHKLTINPEMVFGTGHHETTQMMLEQMQTIDFSGKTVLDLGSGTGILALVAQKEGAQHTLAVDIDEKAFKIMKENFIINNEPSIQATFGTINQVSGKFDRVLANINRNVLLADSEKISQVLQDNGLLVLSGFYIDDKPLLVDKFVTSGLVEQATTTKNKWCSIIFRK